MPVKLDAVLPMARHHSNMFSKGVVLPARAMTQKWAPQTRYNLLTHVAHYVIQQV